MNGKNKDYTFSGCFLIIIRWSIGIISLLSFIFTVSPFITDVFPKLSPEQKMGWSLLTALATFASGIWIEWSFIVRKITETVNEVRKDIKRSMKTIEKSMRSTVAESLGPYGKVSRTRGRDVFGPIVGPADNVTITLSLHEINKHSGVTRNEDCGRKVEVNDGMSDDQENGEYKSLFEYSLTYDIEFSDRVKSSLLIETLIAPIYICDNGNYTCQRYDIPESYQMTIDFNPVIVANKKINKKIPEIPTDVKQVLQKFNIIQGDTIDKDVDSGRKIMIGRVRDEIKIPIKNTLVPKNSHEITAKIEEMNHPIDSQPFIVSPPIQTKELDVICRSKCSLGASQFESVEEFPEVKKTSVEERKIIKRSEDEWEVSGRRWTKKR